MDDIRPVIIQGSQYGIRVIKKQNETAQGSGGSSQLYGIPDLGIFPGRLRHNHTADMIHTETYQLFCFIWSLNFIYLNDGMTITHRYYTRRFELTIGALFNIFSLFSQFV